MEKEIFEEEILIPKERIPVLIGKGGSARKTIEKKGNVKLIVDSKENIVRIKGKNIPEVYTAEKVVEAVGRGFNPETAQKIFKEDTSFEILNIHEYAKNKKRIENLKGRIIGEKGKAKHMIEKSTGAEISVYGKTIGIIGTHDAVLHARHAVEAILTGAKHETAYKLLEEH